MPKMNQVDVTATATEPLVLPESKVTLTIRRRATGRMNHESVQAMLGDAFVYERDAHGRTRVVDLGWNQRRRYNRFLCYLAAELIVDWDALDSAGDPLPISADTFATIESRLDYEFLMDAAAERGTPSEADKGADAPFVQSSEPSSSEESSQIPVSSPTS